MRNPGACPVHVPFPTKKGGAGAADGGVNQETALPYFLPQPGHPQAILGWQDQQALQQPRLPPAHVS